MKRPDEAASFTLTSLPFRRLGTLIHTLEGMLTVIAAVTSSCSTARCSYQFSLYRRTFLLTGAARKRRATLMQHVSSSIECWANNSAYQRMDRRDSRAAHSATLPLRRGEGQPSRSRSRSNFRLTGAAGSRQNHKEGDKECEDKQPAHLDLVVVVHRAPSATTTEACRVAVVLSREERWIAFES